MGALASSQVMTWTITSVVMVIVPRLVGPDDIGAYRISGSLLAMAAVVTAFGTGTYLVLDVARTQERPTAQIGPACTMRVGGALLVIPPLVAIVLLAGYPSLVALLLAIGWVVMVVQSIGDVAGATLTGLERLGPGAASGVINKLVGAALAIPAALITRDVRIVALAYVIATVASTAYILRALHRVRPLDFSTSWARIRELIRAGAPYFVIGITLVAYQQIDVVTMSLLVTDVEIGWYSTADQFAGTLLFIPTMVIPALLPVLTRKHADDPQGAADLLRQTFMTLMLAAVPIGLGIMVVAGPLTVLLFGEDFRGAGPVLAVYGIVIVFVFQTILLGYYALATGRQRLWNIVLVVAIPMTVVLDIILVPIMHDRFDNGAIAGALSYIATEGMMVVVGIWKVAPSIASRPVLVRVLKCLVAGAAMVLVAWPLRELVIVVPVLAGAVTYVLVLLATRPLLEHEWELVHRITGRFPLTGRILGR
jgi:O-antigen/teichoic acid export membrane protein